MAPADPHATGVAVYPALFFFSRVLRDFTPRFVGPSVGPSVRPSHFTFSALMGVLALLLLPKCSTDLNYGPCPPARDWGSRVSGLVLSYIDILGKSICHDKYPEETSIEYLMALFRNPHKKRETEKESCG